VRRRNKIHVEVRRRNKIHVGRRENEKEVVGDYPALTYEPGLTN
jgi:hypothetical protein